MQKIKRIATVGTKTTCSKAQDKRDKATVLRSPKDVKWTMLRLANFWHTIVVINSHATACLANANSKWINSLPKTCRRNKVEKTTSRVQSGRENDSGRKFKRTRVSSGYTLHLNKTYIHSNFRPFPAKWADREHLCPPKKAYLLRIIHYENVRPRSATVETAERHEFVAGLFVDIR